MRVDWFKKAFAATAGYTTFSCLYACIVILLGGGCFLCFLAAWVSIMEGG